MFSAQALTGTNTRWRRPNLHRHLASPYRPQKFRQTGTCFDLDPWLIINCSPWGLYIAQVKTRRCRLPCPCQSPALGCVWSSLRGNAICYLLPTVNFICRTCAICEDTSSWPSIVSFRSLCSMQSALCLFHHGVSVCLQGNRLLHVAVACCSTRRPSTSRHQRRPCQLLPIIQQARLVPLSWP
jgi:hypothetical protein